MIEKIRKIHADNSFCYYSIMYNIFLYSLHLCSSVTNNVKVYHFSQKLCVENLMNQATGTFCLGLWDYSGISDDSILTPPVGLGHLHSRGA